MTDRTCIRGCTQKGIHFATCPDYGKAETFAEARAAGVQNIGYTPTCTGCAPRECRVGSLICDRCFGRARKLLDDLPDLIARLRSVMDPSKATPTDKQPAGGVPSEPLAAVGSDPLDAVIACENVLSWWMQWGEDLKLMSNRLEAKFIFDLILEAHEQDNGLRPWWSVQDAWSTYGPERRPGRHEKPWEPDEDSEEIASFPIAEWGDELVTRHDAWRLAGSERTFQRWVQKELIRPAADITVAGTRTILYRASDVKRIREEMKA